MNRTQTAVIFANSDEDIVATYMILEHDAKLSLPEVEVAMRRAVKQFLDTDEGKKIAEGNHNDFNWGDAVIHVPDKFWIEQGLKVIDTTPRIVMLDHDENLAR